MHKSSLGFKIQLLPSHHKAQGLWCLGLLAPAELKPHLRSREMNLRAEPGWEREWDQDHPWCCTRQQHGQEDGTGTVPAFTLVSLKAQGALSRSNPILSITLPLATSATGV